MAMRDNRPANVTVENARITFKNFAGAEEKFNPKGNRNFALLLDADLATRMIEEGWNVKQLKPREEGDAPQDYIKVKVSYAIKPPRVVLITHKGQSVLDEDTVDMLDYADIAKVDLVINGSFYDVNGKSGYSAYLKSLFVTINEDSLDIKYADLDDDER